MVDNKSSTQVKTVSRDKFVRGMCAALWLRDMKTFHPDDDRTSDGRFLAFHLSMQQAAAWLSATESASRAYRSSCQFLPDGNTGRSSCLERSFWTLVESGFFKLKIPGDGTYFMDFDRELALLEVKTCPVDLGLLDDLAVRFIFEYSFPSADRTWPGQ